MEATVYRQRAMGRGTRVAGKRRQEEDRAQEMRALARLVVSLALFLAVFVGRGVFPARMDALGELLGRDMDLSAVKTALLGEGEYRTALQWVMTALNGADETEPAVEGEGILLPELPDYRERLALPEAERVSESTGEDSGGQAPAEVEVPAAEPEGTAEPVVTAMAQAYSPTGEALPERVSYEYYNLGLEETFVPVMGRVTSDFGFRDHPVSGEYTFHTAVDVAADVGTEVLAFADGTVRYIGEDDVFGLYLKIDHDNGVSTFYAHCDELLVKKGTRVVAGQVVAYSGQTGNATGPHLHFTLEKDGIRLDPEHYLEFGS